jgi:hypothetical protein
VKDGVMTTDDLRLIGPAAKVDIAGDADLARESQRLSVRVQPRGIRSATGPQRHRLALLEIEHRPDADRLDRQGTVTTGP